MTPVELQTKSPAFRAGYHDGYKNIHVTPVPRAPDGDISNYWWGYHCGRRDADQEQKRLIP
jgi:hypothetical protein